MDLGGTGSHLLDNILFFILSFFTNAREHILETSNPEHLVKEKEK